ncbi:hypothetical protein DPMN_014290 [Dreissena polymorpha]|uniref:Apple domain-containing protein n=1 Tax=Dreissena polymorpha TaxID=45954 RepID=A0A9D4NBF7_DREPO|nr:hypothetical protein DPMN_014290 [Dreissena polymorpha]
MNLHDVEVYVGMTRNGTNRLIGFHPGEVDSTATFVMQSPVYGRWIRITRRLLTQPHPLCLCEVQVEGSQVFVTLKQFVLRGEAIGDQRGVRSITQCAFFCSRNVHCVAAKYNETSLLCKTFDKLDVQRVSDETAPILQEATRVRRIDTIRLARFLPSAKHLRDTAQRGNHFRHSNTPWNAEMSPWRIAVTGSINYVDKNSSAGVIGQ